MIANEVCNMPCLTKPLSLNNLLCVHADAVTRKRQDQGGMRFLGEVSIYSEATLILLSATISLLAA